MDGFFNVNKPAGLTSHDVVQRVRRWSRVRRVGHGGTLDPTATGVLPVALGQATRLLEFISPPKVYRASIEFGVETDSYDGAGQVVATADASYLTHADVVEALSGFVGELSQRPPAFSAVKQQGVRLYELARRGVAVETLPRPVQVYAIEMLEWQPPVALVDVTCGRGTYVRSLAHDVGQALGCGAYLRALVRTQDGPFAVETSVSLEELQQLFQEGRAEERLLPLDTSVQHWPQVTLALPLEAAASHGAKLLLAGSPDAAPDARCRGYSSAGRLVALLQYDPADGCWQPFKVFPPPSA